MAANVIIGAAACLVSAFDTVLYLVLFCYWELKHEDAPGAQRSFLGNHLTRARVETGAFTDVNGGDEDVVIDDDGDEFMYTYAN